MEAAIFKANCNPIQLPLLRGNHSPPCSPPFTSLSFRTSPPPYLLSSIKASSSSYAPLPKFQTLSHDQVPFSLVKTTIIAAVTATAVFLTRVNLKPVIAAPMYPPATVETDAGEDVLRSNPHNVEALSIDALKILVEIRMKNQQVKDAIIVMERLISLLPDDEGLPLAKAFMHLNVKEPELAKLGFQEVLSKDPLCVKACDGLLMAAMESESSSELKQIERLIAEGMEKCKKERKKDILREFKFVLAQVFVFEEAYDDALKIYEELVKEERGDFRPYLSQGIIYTFLSKREEAEKCFSKFKRLVPKGHPYYDYIDKNMLQEVLSKKVESKSNAMVDEQVMEGDKDSFKVEEQVIEDERDALNTDEDTVEDGIDFKKIEEEQVVEDDRGELKNEEDIVENEKASPSVSDEQAIRSE